MKGDRERKRRKMTRKIALHCLEICCCVLMYIDRAGVYTESSTSQEPVCLNQETERQRGRVSTQTLA